MAKISKAEKFVDWLITPAVIILTVLVFGELLFGFDKYEPWITIADLIVVAIFVADLFFKWQRVHDVKKFVKLYWLEILAVFPFYLLFRAVSFAGGLLGPETERTIHQASLLRRSTQLRTIFQEEELIGRGIRLSQRLLRLLAARLVHAKDRVVFAHHKVKAS